MDGKPLIVVAKSTSESTFVIWGHESGWNSINTRFTEEKFLDSIQVKKEAHGLILVRFGV